MLNAAAAVYDSLQSELNYNPSHFPSYLESAMIQDKQAYLRSETQSFPAHHHLEPASSRRMVL